MSCSIQASRKYHVLFRVGDFSTPPIINCGTRIKILVYNTIHVNGSYCIQSSADGFRLFSRPHFGFGHLGLRTLWVRVEELVTGGSGDGSSGNGGGNSGGGGGRESNWSLLSWYLYLSKWITAPGASGAFLRLFLDQNFPSCLVTLEGRPSLVIPKLRQTSQESL